MCGIWGAVAPNEVKVSHATEKFLRNAAIAGTVRGLDGTGIVSVTTADWNTFKGQRVEEDPNVYYHKSGGTGPEMLRELGTLNAWFHEQSGRPNCVYGHNRAATVGKINRNTAHPFVAARTIGIHNGTLSSGWGQRLQASKKVSVDSEALIRCISHRGYKHALEQAKGAMAVVWTNLETRETFIFRNYERPVHYCISTFGSLYFASEEGMLAWLLKRANITPDSDGIQSLKPSTVYNITDATMVEVESIYNTASTYSHNQGGGYSQWLGNGSSTSTTRTSYVNPTGRSCHHVNDATTRAGTTLGKSDRDTEEEVCDQSDPPLTISEMFDDADDCYITDDGHIVTDYKPARTIIYSKCEAGCGQGLIRENSDDYICIHTPQGKVKIHDNDACLHDYFSMGGGTNQFAMCPFPVDFIMYTDDWGSDPITEIHPYLTGGVEHVYLSDTLQARAEVQPRIKTKRVASS